jgi:hypothetical protein
MPASKIGCIDSAFCNGCGLITLNPVKRQIQNGVLRCCGLATVKDQSIMEAIVEFIFVVME